jgi:hypothetical protein
MTFDLVMRLVVRVGSAATTIATTTTAHGPPGGGAEEARVVDRSGHFLFLAAVGEVEPRSLAGNKKPRQLLLKRGAGCA